MTIDSLSKTMKKNTHFVNSKMTNTIKNVDQKLANNLSVVCIF